MSNDRLLKLLQRGVGTEYDIDPADVALYRCPPEVMDALMGELDAAGASAGAGAGWLRHYGMTESELATLRARLAG
jgi:hypothetical protein